MVIEIAHIEVKTGSVEKFEAGVRAAREIFLAAEGCRGMALWRSVEHDLRYRLVVEWDTLEHHTVTFRQSPGFAAWRQLVQDCFASPPQVEHQSIVPLD
jgi:heme-degrading monooxygenase HmoA